MSGQTTRTRRIERGPGGPTAPPRRSDLRRPAGPARARGRRAPHHWFAEQLLLVLSGVRPVHSLLGHTRDRAYEQLSRVAPRTPLRPPPGQRGAPTLRGVGACLPHPDVIEAFARVAAGGRTRALAFRLERADNGRWLCCAVELDTVR
ncbi:Rv3235 family protein [Streptomyces sp. 4N509B]|uniref:Rv3235 family protein n=1 Tax=Streptomyces sp. 4N509B TaxID=3457413 RepID=UPI003FCFE88B